MSPAKKKSSPRPTLDVEGRRWLDEVIDTRLASQTNGVDTRAEGLAVAHDVERAIQKDEGRAHRVRLYLTALGAADEVKRRVKATVGTVILSRDGAVLSIPKRFGTRRFDAESGQYERVWQQRLWVEMDRDQFEALSNWLQRHSARTLNEYAWTRRLLEKWDEHPAATTAGKVCELAGLDPYNLDLGEDTGT